MAETEGVIKYRLSFTRGEVPDQLAEELSGWRELLVRLGMLGQDEHRYAGFGFGNISMRHPKGGFVVSASQTGGVKWPTGREYAWVTRVNLARNEVDAKGILKPSSEALTHAAVYALDAQIQFVFHGHVPEIWRHGSQAGMPVTDPALAYGTPEMAEEVRRLQKPILAAGIFLMGGHEDGVVSFGASAEEAGTRLVAALAASLAAAGQSAASRAG